MRILGVSGSLQASSSNTALLRAAATSAPAASRVELYNGLAALPHFNPDLDTAEPPPAVADLRAAIVGADAVLFSTPEYAHALPGALKDMLDWLVGSGELVDKPVAVLSASPGLEGGAIAGDALVALLGVLSARVVAQLAVGATRSKRDEQGGFVDGETLTAVAGVVKELLTAAAGPV